jgi:hypothetical protein
MWVICAPHFPEWTEIGMYILSNMAVKSQFLVLSISCSLAVALLWPLSGCNQSEAHAVNGTQVADSLQADTNRAKPAALVPPPSMPALKSAAALQQLEMMHAAALAAERKLLSSPALDKAMDALKDFVGADGIAIHGEIAEPQFVALSIRERLAYTLWHPEGYAEDESSANAWAGQVQGIARRLPSDLEGDVPRDRQIVALRKDTTALKKVVLECLRTNNSVSIPLMRIIADFKIFDATLPLIDIYHTQTTKDDLILTTLSILMEKGMYWKWLQSETFKAMLVDPNGMIPWTAASAEAFIAFAQSFAAR